MKAVQGPLSVFHCDQLYLYSNLYISYLCEHPLFACSNCMQIATNSWRPSYKLQYLCYCIMHTGHIYLTDSTAWCRQISLVNSGSAEINKVLSKAARLNSNIMTIFTYLHFCLREQTHLHCLLCHDKRTFGKGRWHEGGKTRRAKGLRKGRKAAGNTANSTEFLLPCCYISHLSRGSAQGFAPHPPLS